MNTLLSHEATGDHLWTAAKQHNCRSHDNDNMTNVLRPDYIYTYLKKYILKKYESVSQWFR